MLTPFRATDISDVNVDVSPADIHLHATRQHRLLRRHLTVHQSLRTMSVKHKATSHMPIRGVLITFNSIYLLIVPLYTQVNNTMGVCSCTWSEL